MSKADYALLQDVITDDDFPDLDLALRRGRHVDREDGAWYALLTDAQELLEPFYRRYGCELIHKTDGYFYLLPTGEKVSRKQLSATDMLVGQALALLYLDPAAVERGGVVTQEEVVGQLSAVLGTDTLIAAFNPGKRKSKDERIAQRNVRQRVAEAVRRLAGLGFVEVNDASGVRLRAALLRFAEPVRGLSEPAEALAKLVALGDVALTPEEPGNEVDADAGESAEHDAAADGGESVEQVDAADGGGFAAESGERVDRAAAALSGGLETVDADGGQHVDSGAAALSGGLEAVEGAGGARIERGAAGLSGGLEAVDVDTGARFDSGAAELSSGREREFEPGDETGVLRRLAAHGGDGEAGASEGLPGDDADGGVDVDGSAAGSPESEDDGELEWADIFVPAVAVDGHGEDGEDES